MSEPTQPTTPQSTQYPSLPAKITGLVFWGLVIVGIIASIAILQVYEKQLPKQHQAKVSLTGSSVEKLISANPLKSLVELENDFLAIQANMDIPAIRVNYRGQTTVIGETQGDLVRHQHPFSVHVNDPLTGQGTMEFGEVIVFQASLQSTIVKVRENILLGMGILFTAFGFILQWVLNKILAVPFSNMVETAQRASAGEKNVRFDDNRKDEFGFLSKFINQSMDHLTRQQKDLEKALRKQRRAEKELTREKEHAIVTLESIADAVIRTDVNGTVEYLNPVAEVLTDYSEKDAVGKSVTSILKLTHEIGGETVDDPVLACIEQGEPIYHEGKGILLVKKDEQIDIEFSVAPIRNNKDEITGAVMIIQDVRQARELTRQLSYQASHDALTGIFNRREFENYLRTAIQSAKLESKQHALCFIDLDQFKIVNDTCGHIAGDELLKNLAALLTDNIRDSDSFGDFETDYFRRYLVLLEHVHNIRQEITVAQTVT